MKGEQTHKEHKSSSGLSSALKKVKAKFTPETPKPKSKSPYTRDQKFADTVFAYRVMAGRSTFSFCNAWLQALWPMLTQRAETRM